MLALVSLIAFWPHPGAGLSPVSDRPTRVRRCGRLRVRRLAEREAGHATAEVHHASQPNPTVSEGTDHIGSGLGDEFNVIGQSRPQNWAVAPLVSG
jgi:hypothetical protein